MHFPARGSTDVRPNRIRPVRTAEIVTFDGPGVRGGPNQQQLYEGGRRDSESGDWGLGKGDPTPHSFRDYVRRRKKSVQ